MVWQHSQWSQREEQLGLVLQLWGSCPLGWPGWSCMYFGSAPQLASKGTDWVVLGCLQSFGVGLCHVKWWASSSMVVQWLCGRACDGWVEREKCNAWALLSDAIEPSPLNTVEVNAGGSSHTWANFWMCSSEKPTFELAMLGSFSR